MGRIFWLREKCSCKLLGVDGYYDKMRDLIKKYTPVALR